MIRTIPNSFPISYICEAVRNAVASRILCWRCRSTEDRGDVLTMSAGQCRQSAEGVPKFFSASKFCSGPNLNAENLLSPEGAETCKTVPGRYRQWKESFRICGQAAESCGFINYAFRILSWPCGGLVLGASFSEILNWDSWIFIENAFECLNKRRPGPSLYKPMLCKTRVMHHFLSTQNAVMFHLIPLSMFND